MHLELILIKVVKSLFNNFFIVENPWCLEYIEFLLFPDQAMTDKRMSLTKTRELGKQTEESVWISFIIMWPKIQYQVK